MSARNPARRAAASDLAAAAPVFAALGDRTRLGLVTRLCDDGPQSIAELTRGLPITRQGVTKHLHVMEQAGIVQATEHGRERVWRLDPHRLAAARRHLDRISSEWDSALDRLKAFVEVDEA